MQYRELAEMYAVETRHWWFAGKRLLFKRLLRTRLAVPDLKILDVGCGTGAAAVDFSRFGGLWATDRSLEALRFVTHRGVANVFASEAGRLPIVGETFDLITAFDVLEHVDDDAAMLEDLARTLRPGGAVAIHVPAWPSLWSQHDEVLEHKRRYTRRSLRALLDASPLTVEYLGWTNATIFPVAMLVRTLQNLTGSRGNGQDIVGLPGPLNAVALSIYRAEVTIAATLGLPFGLSLAAVAARR